MSFWDTLGDVGLGVSTGGLSTVAGVHAGDVTSGKVFGDIGDGISGHAGAAPGTVWGEGSPQAQAAAQHAASLGMQQGNTDAQLGANASAQLGGIGNAQAGSLARLGQGQAQTMNGIGSMLYGQQAPTIATAATNRDNSDARHDASMQGHASWYLGQAAAGNGPSAAQAQFRAGLDQSIAAQQAQANSVHGGFGLANAQANAVGAGANMMQQTSNQSAQLRAQEMQAAQAQYAQATQAARGQDISQTQTDASMAQAQAQLQAQQKAQNQAGLLSATQFGAGQQLSAANAGANMNLAGAQAGVNAQYGYQGLGQGQAMQGQTLGSNINTAAANTALGNQGIKQGNIDANAAATQGMYKTILSTGASAAGLASDARVKADVRADDAPTDAFLGTLAPHTYRYDSPEHEPRAQANGGHYLGVMAQNVEKTPLGAQMVEHGPGGVKQLSQPALMSGLAAGEGRLHQRLAALEAHLGIR